MPMPAPRAIMALFALALMTACANVAPPPQLELGGRTCEAKAYLAAARPLPFPTKDAEPVVVDVDAASPCLQEEGAPGSIYLVFALPVTVETYFISVASTPVGQGVFPPRIGLLDADGAPMREIMMSGMLFRGTDLTAEFRSHAGERYLLVKSDKNFVGQKISRVAVGINQSGFMLGSAYVPIYRGTDAISTLTYSYNGKITVTVRPPQAAQ